MLKALRKKGVAKKIFIVLAIVIVPAFVLWGSASLIRSQKYSYAGKIFGKKVSFDEFQESLQAVRTQALMQFGENFYKVQRFLRLEKEAWDRLILLHEARKRRIHILDQEVIEEISQLPFFQRDGKFDNKTYQSMLEYGLRVPPRFFEEQIRQQLMLNKLYRQITDKISVNDEELLSAYKKETEKVKVSYVFISPANFEKEVALKKDEAQDYFKGHLQEFKQPPTIDIQYFGFDYPREAKEENKEALLNKLLGIYSQLQKGESLEKITTENNIAIKETGFFSPEQPSPSSAVPFELIQTASLLEDNKFSHPILASTGCYLAKIKTRRDAYLPDFTEVKAKVEKTLIEQKSRSLAQEKAQQFYDKLKSRVKYFEKIAKEFGLKINQTSLFKLGEYLPVVGPSIEFQNAAFSLKEKDKISEVISTLKGFYILKVDEFVPIDAQKFKKEKEEFKAKLLEQRKREFYNNFFEELKKKANLQDNISRMKAGLYY